MRWSAAGGFGPLVAPQTVIRPPGPAAWSDRCQVASPTDKNGVRHRWESRGERAEFATSFPHPPDPRLVAYRQDVLSEVLAGFDLLAGCTGLLVRAVVFGQGPR